MTNVRVLVSGSKVEPLRNLSAASVAKGTTIGEPEDIDSVSAPVAGSNVAPVSLLANNSPAVTDRPLSGADDTARASALHLSPAAPAARRLPAASK